MERRGGGGLASLRLASVLLLCACTVAIAWLGCPKPVRGIGSLSTSINLRSANDIYSLRALLSEGETRDRLLGLAESAALLGIGTRSLDDPANCPEPQPPGDVPASSTLHDFVFAEEQAISSRIFVVRLGTCRSPDWTYAPRHFGQGFESDSRLEALPILSGAEAFTVLCEALKNATVGHALVQFLVDKNITYCRVRLVGEFATGVRTYRFIVSDKTPNEAERSVLVYECDLETTGNSISSFQLVEPEGEDV